MRLHLGDKSLSLANHAMIDVSMFNEVIWCQASPSLRRVTYHWYGPAERLNKPLLVRTEIHQLSEIPNSTVVAVLVDGKVGLARAPGKSLGDNEGIYQCVIKNDTVTYTLSFGVYRTENYNQNSELFRI